MSVPTSIMLILSHQENDFSNWEEGNPDDEREIPNLRQVNDLIRGFGFDRLAEVGDHAAGGKVMNFYIYAGSYYPFTEDHVEMLIEKVQSLDWKCPQAVILLVKEFEQVRPLIYLQKRGEWHVA